MEQVKETPAPRSRSRAKAESVNWSHVGWTLAGYACQGLILGATGALGARMFTPTTPILPDLAIKDEVVTPIRGAKTAIQ